jgi:hypothetical protein
MIFFSPQIHRFLPLMSEKIFRLQLGICSFSAKTQRSPRLCGEVSLTLFELFYFHRNFTAEPQSCQRLRRENE